MTDNQNELLSALVDGELHGNELDDVLQLLQTDEQAQRQLQRYQYGSDVLGGHRLAYVDISRQISLALEDEASFSVTNNKTATPTAKILTFPQQFWKQAASLAVAASIGALTVVGVMNQAEEDYSNQFAGVQVETVPMIVAKTGERWTVGEQEVEERLNSYLVDHNEYSGASGVFSYARVVSYDLGQ